MKELTEKMQSLKCRLANTSSLPMTNNYLDILKQHTSDQLPTPDVGSYFSNLLCAQQGSGGGAKKNFEGKKGKGKGNGKPFISMPKELLDFNPMAKSGKRICFAYNLDGCSARGAECKKGVHVCMRCGSSEHGQRSSRCKGSSR